MRLGLRRKPVPIGTGDPYPQARGWPARAQVRVKDLSKARTPDPAGLPQCVSSKILGCLGGALDGVGFPALLCGAESAEGRDKDPRRHDPLLLEKWRACPPRGESQNQTKSLRWAWVHLP